MADILVTHSNGSTVNYNASSDTDASRGSILMTAMQGAITGDSLLLAAKTFNIGDNVIDLSLTGSGTVHLYGSGKFLTTVVATSVDSFANIKPRVTSGNNSIIQDLGIVVNTNSSSYGPCWGSNAQSFTNAILNNVYLSGLSDCIILNSGNCSAKIINCTIFSRFDCFNPLSSSNLNFVFYDCQLTSTPNPFIVEGGQTGRAFVINGSSGVPVFATNVIVTTFNCTVVVSGGSAHNVGYFVAGSTNFYNIYGGSTSTSGTGAIDLENLSGTINATPGSYSTTSGNAPRSVLGVESSYYKPARTGLVLK